MTVGELQRMASLERRRVLGLALVGTLCVAGCTGSIGLRNVRIGRVEPNSLFVSFTTDRDLQGLEKEGWLIWFCLWVQQPRLPRNSRRASEWESHYRADYPQDVDPVQDQEVPPLDLQHGEFVYVARFPRKHRTIETGRAYRYDLTEPGEYHLEFWLEASLYLYRAAVSKHVLVDLRIPEEQKEDNDKE